MRAYFFGNYYLSSLQQGLQAGHVIGQLFNKYTNHSTELETTHQSGQSSKLYDWVRDHQTIIILNGGNSTDLNDLYNKLVPFADDFELPIAFFEEDTMSLNGATTSVGIILPEALYDYDLNGELVNIQYGIMRGVSEIPLSPEGRLKQIIDGYRLAH